MTKIYLQTNAYDLVAVIDDDAETVYYGTPSDMPTHPTKQEAQDYLEQATSCEFIGILLDTMPINDWQQMLQDFANNNILVEIEE